MRKLTEILRFRFDKKIADILKQLPKKSDFVRIAVREKMERENLIKKISIKTQFKEQICVYL